MNIYIEIFILTDAKPLTYHNQLDKQSEIAERGFCTFNNLTMLCNMFLVKLIQLTSHPVFYFLNHVFIYLWYSTPSLLKKISKLTTFFYYVPINIRT